MALDHVVDALGHDAVGALELLFGHHDVDVAQVVLAGHIDYFISKGAHLASLTGIDKHADGAGSLAVLAEEGRDLEEHFLLFAGGFVGDEDFFFGRLATGDGDFDGGSFAFVIQSSPGFFAENLCGGTACEFLDRLVPERDLALAVDRKDRHRKGGKQALSGSALGFFVFRTMIHLVFPLVRHARLGGWFIFIPGADVGLPRVVFMLHRCA